MTNNVQSLVRRAVARLAIDEAFWHDTMGEEFEAYCMDRPMVAPAGSMVSAVGGAIQQPAFID